MHLNLQSMIIINKKHANFLVACINKWLLVYNGFWASIDSETL